MPKNKSSCSPYIALCVSEKDAQGAFLRVSLRQAGKLVFLFAEGRGIEEGGPSSTFPDKEAESRRHMEEISIKFAKGLCSEPFMSKSGKEFVRIQIPNSDHADHDPWQEFVLESKQVHENQYGKGLWAKIPAGDRSGGPQKGSGIGRKNSGLRGRPDHPERMCLAIHSSKIPKSGLTC